MFVRTPSPRPSARPPLAGLAGRPHPALFFAPDAGDNPASGTGGQGDPPPSLTGILQRHGNDPIRVVETLLDENYTYRARVRELQGQLPAAGAVVLDAAQAQAWAAYQALGAADALQQQIEAAQGASQELASLKRAQLVRDVAEVAGYKASVLADRAQGLDLAVREVQANGTTERRSVVVTNGVETPLADYAQQHWADYLPALQRSPAAAPPSGTAFPRQQGSTGGGTGDIAQDFLVKAQAARDAAPNPLAPKQA